MSVDCAGNDLTSGETDRVSERVHFSGGGSLVVAGIGPGSVSQMTRRVFDALSRCDCVVGYGVYVALVRDSFPDKKFLTTPMRREEERCLLALGEARGGSRVVLVCSGDAGVYALSSLVLEIASRGEFPGVEISCLPGVTAALSGSAALGSPISGDFAAVSLSDLMTPWEKIEGRLRAAAGAGFCIAIYNPMSGRRSGHLRRACETLLEILPGSTPCGWVRNIDRDGEESRVCALSELKDAALDMFTTVFVGNSETKTVEVCGRRLLVTPRGYKIGSVGGAGENSVGEKSASGGEEGRILVFAGTSEGRELCERLVSMGFPCAASVASGYGKTLLGESERLEVLAGRMGHDEMAALLSGGNFRLAVDATHPFATEASSEIRTACRMTGKPYIRLARDTGGAELDFPEMRFFGDIESAGAWLDRRAGKIFATTGGKSLERLAARISDISRIFARVLPSVQSLEACERCGIAPSRIFAMQGPFSERMNEVQFAESGARFLLTKESGESGGFFGKVAAARKLGMEICVIRNPESRAVTGAGDAVFRTVGEVVDFIASGGGDCR